RRQPELDYGIDAHIEVVIAEKPTGRLVAAQIKTGKSYLSEKTDKGFVYRGDRDHLAYWLNSSLPVVVILVDEKAKRAWYQHITADTIELTKTKWKVVVPFKNELNDNARDDLEEISDVPESVRRLAELTLALSWMRFIREGKPLFVEARDWVNKSSGRAELDLIVTDEDRQNPKKVLTW